MAECGDFRDLWGVNGHMECSNVHPAFPREFCPTRGEH